MFLFLALIALAILIAVLWDDIWAYTDPGFYILYWIIALALLIIFVFPYTTKHSAFVSQKKYQVVSYNFPLCGGASVLYKEDDGTLKRARTDTIKVSDEKKLIIVTYKGKMGFLSLPIKCHEKIFYIPEKDLR